jgi:hypothetical protein
MQISSGMSNTNFINDPIIYQDETLVGLQIASMETGAVT